MSPGPLQVLFLAYHFPPTGGGGAQRSTKFVRYLPGFDVDPLVVTGNARAESRWSPRDSAAMSEVPERVRIFRIPEPEPEPASRGQRLLDRLLDRPRAFSKWWVSGCVEAATRAAQHYEPALIYASLAPYETAEAAIQLSARLGLPWVADLRDPWALDEMRPLPSWLHRRRMERRMRRQLAEAHTVIMNTPEATRALAETFPEFHDRSVLTITNGFDGADFVGEPPQRSDSEFRIVHAGSLHTELGQRHRRRFSMQRLAGGERVRTDILTRSIVFLLDALVRWRREAPEAAERVRLVLIGALSSEDRKLIQDSPAADLVVSRGQLDHSNTVGEIRSADLLFLPMHNLPHGERARIVPGKAYEYMASGRPILAAVPDGDAKDFLLQLSHAHVCRPDDVEEMLRLLQTCFEQGRAAHASPSGDGAFLASFERRHLTGQLASTFRQVMDGEPENVPDQRTSASPAASKPRLGPA